MSNIILNTEGTPLNLTAEGPAGGFLALGMAGKKFAVFSLLNKQVLLLSTSELKEMPLKAMFGAKWCEVHYTEFHEKKEEFVFNHKRMASDILSACQAAGSYTGSTERRAGVWKMADGSLVVNGHELWKPDGTVMEHGIIDGRVYPVSGDVGFGPQTPPAQEDEVAQVLASFKALPWENPLGSELLLGFLGVAMTATAMRRRPHLMLTGAAGCGKSSMLEQVRWLLGDLAFACTGRQTMAGLYQSVGGTAKTVVCDEFEADPNSKSCKDILEVARMSYSLGEGDEGIVRGSNTGNSVSYRFFSPFIAAGISPGKMEPADVSRWLVLESKGKPNGARLTEEQARELGPKLARLFINRWSVFQASEEMVRQRIMNVGGDGRLADTVGTLLASYWAFVSATPATEQDADALIGKLGLQERIAFHQPSDEEECLEALTSRVVPFKVLNGHVLCARSLTIGQAIELVCKDPTGQPDVVVRLAQLGLRVAMNRGKWVLYVSNSPLHHELRKLFAGTKWSTGGWSVVLRRLPGGEESTQRIGAGFAPGKVTAIDVPAHWLPANDESDMLLAA